MLKKISYMLHPVVLCHIHLTSYALFPKPVYPVQNEQQMLRLFPKPRRSHHRLFPKPFVSTMTNNI